MTPRPPRKGVSFSGQRPMVKTKKTIEWKVHPTKASEETLIPAVVQYRSNDAMAVVR